MTQNQPDFGAPASETTLHRVAVRMRERNIAVLIVNHGEDVRQIVVERLPKGGAYTRNRL
jgi:hypothetical protein